MPSSSSSLTIRNDSSGHKTLLGSVMKVPLDASPSVIAGLDDPDPRRLHLHDLGSQIGLEALVVEREAGRNGVCLDEPGILQQRPIVDDCGEPFTVALDDSRRPAAIGGR